MNRRLYRCRHDRLIAGVASGVAERFEIDPTLVRLLWIVSVFFGGLGLFLYVVMAIIVPMEPEGEPIMGGPAGDPTAERAAADASAATGAGWHPAPAAHRHEIRDHSRVVTIFGMALILFGSLALVEALAPGVLNGGRFIVPAFVVGIGALLVASAVRREPTA